MHYRSLPTSVLFLLITSLVAISIQFQSENANTKTAAPLMNTEYLLESESEINRQRLKRATTRRPGFFKTLFSVIYEQWGDTRNTINKVNTLINDNFLPENTPKAKVTTTTASTDTNASTTEAPYKITRTEFNRIISRNLRGIVRLYNIELRDALKQSERYNAEFRKNLTKEVSKFL